MAGFRDFQTGEVLTAANVNDFLMQQSVMKFADAAARNTALGTAVGGSNALREGMVAWLDSDDELQTFDGTAWSAVGGGGLVEVKSAIFTGTQTASVGTGANVAVTDLTITHETADAANKLIITANIGVVATSDQVGLAGIAVYDGTNLIGVGDTAGNRTRVSAGGRPSSGTGPTIATSQSFTFVHTPGSGSKTYTVRAVNFSDATRTVYINRTEADGDTSNRQRGASSLVIQEVKV